MYHRILVGYQETERGRDALELGQILARANGAEMVISTAPAEDGGGLRSWSSSGGPPSIELVAAAENGAPPYLVRWEDGHESEVFPGSDIFIQHLGDS